MTESNKAQGDSTRVKLLRDAADACDELAADYRRESQNMGPTKGKSYIRMAGDLEGQAQALIKWADELATELVALCPHGFVLADNICGPCSQGKPNRRPYDAKAHSECYP